MFRWPLLGLLLFCLLVVFASWWVLRASLPRLDGEIVAEGVSAPVVIERDDLGVPTLRAATRLDLAFATGYVHAQDRFFQMDLQRRLAAGELAELFGPAASDNDRALRRHQFTRVSDEVLRQVSSEELALLEAYAGGVNRALEDLRVRPWEYLLLGTQPRAWQPRDSLLVAFAMYLDLNDSDGEREIANATLTEVLPPEILTLLYPLGTEWDAPVDGGTWRLPPLPGEDVWDLSSEPIRQAALSVPAMPLTERTGDAALGSNSWAVAGSLTVNGGALLANDMHLGLQVPNIWYRARLIVDPHNGEPVRDLIGVTLPGLPVLVVGSNGQVAWGFTNTHGDWTDLVIVDVDPENENTYLSASGPQPLEYTEEVIRIRGQSEQVMTVARTEWGPIVGENPDGTLLALAWMAHRPEATNLKMFGFETARTVDEALAIANESGGPVQNFVAADAQGRIGWTLFGRIPVREGYDSRLPARWNADIGWTRWRLPEEYPRIVDPLNGRLWTANTRTIDAATWIEFMGPDGYVLGARAGQIRDGLLAARSPTAADMLAIQLDDRALFLARWRDLLLELLDSDVAADHPDQQAVRGLIEEWSGRAAVDDAGYRIVRTFRRAVLTGTFAGLIAPARVRYPDKRFEPGQQFEGPLWQLVTERPLHLLDPQYVSWDEALLAWFDDALKEIRGNCDDHFADCGWGRSNALSMRHPLSRALPFSSRLLDMPRQSLPGDSNMPRVQSPRQGASERLVVSPGREAEGFFQMPGGQSAHPLSPYYRAGHDAWVDGQSQPLLPGQTRHALRLLPSRR